MGESSAQTVNEIEAARDRLSHDLDELEERVPGGSALRLGLRLAVGGGVGGTLAWMALRYVRRRAMDLRPVVVSPPSVDVSVNVIPDEWTRSLGSGRTKAVLAVGAAAWFFLRVLELRASREAS